jgi:cysteine desulfurase/selenocysteine lyase
LTGQGLGCWSDHVGATGQLDLAGLRAEFDLSDGLIWMQHAGGARFPRRAAEAVRRAATAMHSGMDWPEQYVADRTYVREAVARLVGGAAETVVFVRSTGQGLSLAARGLDWKRGDNVVGARWEFPTNLVPWMALERQGVELRLVEPCDGRVTPEAVMALVDDRTRVVALSHVQFWNGYRVDIERLGPLLRERDIVFVVDSIQASGTIPTDVRAAQVDVLACGAIKWLMGPVGIGFAQLDPRMVQRLEPTSFGTGSLAEPENSFAPEFELAEGGRRFEESATSWFDIAGLRASLELIEEVGVDVIHQRVTDLTDRIGTELARRGHEVVAPWPRSRAESSAIVSFRTPGVDPDEQYSRLEDHGVIARRHHDFVRLSPHAYLTDDEVERALLAIRDPS